VLEKIKEFLDERLPDARYSDGTKTRCIFYRACNVFDIRDD
jgi:hypothetical protein